ncbi:MAG TPA: hypothetical protein VF215_05150, partial [Thermoanaerobaculia bacterium]
AALLAGQKSVALEAAAAVGDDVPVEVARDIVALQEMHAYLHLTRVAFGEWQAVLDMPLPDASLRYASGLAWYARGVAAARLGRSDILAQAIDSVTAIAEPITDEPFASSIDIALHVLRAEHAAAAGSTSAAIEHLTQAAALEDGLSYMEPPYWHKPVRHMLGAALLREGRFADAERAYREDLHRFPENGWALRGLVSALEGQGRHDDAAEARAALAQAWSSADITLPASTF